jgi:CDP-diacylglycerol--serine O-phosphatidyltransferase
MVDFRKTYFLLPNLFTLASVFCGFYAITLCARLGDEGSDEDLLYKAALAIVIGLFFDATDGRIARLTRTQSELGLNLDSLADIVTFGAAPALLVYRWGLEGLGKVGMFVAFLFLACGALRLARFNVLSLREEASGKAEPGKYMLGLGIPIAANFIVGMVLVNHAIGLNHAVNQASIAVIVVVLSYLMISRVRFRTMKDLQANRRTLGAAVLVLVLAIIVGARISTPAVFMLLITTYVMLGLLEEVLFFRRRRAEELATARYEPEDDEGDVLAELGANGTPQVPAGDSLEAAEVDVRAT